MPGIQGFSGVRTITMPDNLLPNNATKAKSNIDTYTPGAIEESSLHEHRATNPQMKREQAEVLSQKYDLRNMDRNQYSKLLMELRDSGIITSQEYSTAYAGTMPCGGAVQGPAFPYGKEKADFVQLLHLCADSCENISSSYGPEAVSLATTYRRLSGLFSQIDQARNLVSAGAAAPAPNEYLRERYGDKAVQLYEQLKADENWLNRARGIEHLSDDSTITARELAKELLLSDQDLLESIAKQLWVRQAENNKRCLEDNEPERMGRLPKDYQEIVDNIKKILNGTAPEKMDMYGDFLVPDSRIHSYMGPIDAIYSSLDTFLTHKAEKEPLSDVERLLSKRAAQVEKYIWQNFDGQMKDIQNKINGQLEESGFSFDIDKEYQFYLNSDFTFSVKGGSEEENKKIADALNTHPRENYKYDPLHETLMALYFSRPDDLSIAPWRVGAVSDELVQKYGVSSNISDSYTQKMKHFLSAYEWHEMDRSMRHNYGFGINDIYLSNGKLTGKTDEITKLIEKMDIEELKEISHAFANIQDRYMGTPEFFEPVFVFKDGKFQLTYEN